MFCWCSRWCWRWCFPNKAKGGPGGKILALGWGLYYTTYKLTLSENIRKYEKYAALHYVAFYQNGAAEIETKDAARTEIKPGGSKYVEKDSIDPQYSVASL